MTDFRRHDDDPLYQRLTQLEAKFGTLENKVNTLTLEQKHMLEMFSAKFNTLERTQELMISEVRGLNQSIVNMAAEADKSPAGRGLLNLIDELRKHGVAHDGEAKSRDASIKDLQEWQNKIDGVLYVLKWMGASGVAALVWVALRTFGKVP